MDLEQDHSAAPWTAIFHPIHALPPTLLQKQTYLLKNSFSLTPHPHHAGFTLTLFPKALLLSFLSVQQEQWLGYAEVSFDLKFEVIYEQEKNIKSPKKGLRFLYDKTRNFTLYSTSPIVQAWSICLALHLNQVGFHQMFKPLKKLGRGNFASVYEVQRVTDRRRFAVKAFSKQNCFSGKAGKQSLMNELSIMRRLSCDTHQNLLRLQGVYQSQNSIYVVQEILPGGQLLHRIKERNGYFSEEEVREFMFGLLSGLQHMHGHRIMHRDLKPENIMLRNTPSMSPVIVDYGLATHADVEKYLFFRCGTPGYVAPEIIALTQNKHIEPQCDIFSVGAIFHILLTRRPLFEGTQYEQVYRKNKEMKFSLQGQVYEGVDVLAISLLKSMLIDDPKERITAGDALRHPYFNGQLYQLQKVSSPVPTSCGLRREWSLV